MKRVIMILALSLTSSFGNDRYPSAPPLPPGLKDGSQNNVSFTAPNTPDQPGKRSDNVAAKAPPSAPNTAAIRNKAGNQIASQNASQPALEPTGGTNSRVFSSAKETVVAPSKTGVILKKDD